MDHVTQKSLLSSYTIIIHSLWRNWNDLKKNYAINWNDFYLFDDFLACNCNQFFATGNCADSTGLCECKPQFTPPNCDSCSYGYFGYPDCKPCECDLRGTDGYHCEAVEGSCPCKNNYAGHYCNLCAEGYYKFPECLCKHFINWRKIIFLLKKKNCYSF